MPSISIRDTVSGTTTRNEYVDAIKVDDGVPYDGWIFVPYSMTDHFVYVQCRHGTDVDTTEFEWIKTPDVDIIPVSSNCHTYQFFTSDILDRVGLDLLMKRVNKMASAYLSEKSSDDEVESLKKELQEKESRIQELIRTNDKLRNVVIDIWKIITDMLGYIERSKEEMNI